MKSHSNDHNDKDIEEKSKDHNILEKERDEYKNKYLRALADYQNLENRIFKDRVHNETQIRIRMLIQLLPVLDTLEKAEIFVKDPGLKIVKDSFEKYLKDMGVTEIELDGKEYDPNLAEAVEVVNGEKDNIITEVLRKGYKLDKAILRPAQVKVSKKAS